VSASDLGGWGLRVVVVVGDSNLAAAAARAADDEVVNGLSCGADGQRRWMIWSWTKGESVKPEIYDRCTS